jgi:hypothetical protein
MDTASSPTENRPSRHLWLLALVCLGAFWLRTAGLYWPKFHPDEHPIAGWIEQTAERGYITDKVYAGGFFALARPVHWTARAVQRRLQAIAYHQGTTNQPEPLHFDDIIFARWLNVWLSIFTCLLFYGLARRITGSGGAGVLAAALFAFAQYPIEHSHYGETDSAMLFTLAAAGWLWASAIDNRRWIAFGAAALVSGFAAGTKFTLTLLIAMPLIVALMQIGRPLSRRGLARGLGYLGLGLGLFALGLVLANPRLVVDWPGFQAGLAWENRRVWGETALNLGILRGNPAVRYAHHGLELWHSLLTLGWGWIGLALVGIPCACRRQYRRFWPILLAFPAIFTGYWIFGAPWVRSQEFMTYLPALAVLATLPLGALWQARRFPVRALAVLLGGLALLLNAENGLRAAALFGWTDTRLLVRQWLEQRLPENARLAAEPYSEQACPDSQIAPVPIGGKIERNGVAHLKAPGVDFVLRTASHSGRGLVHPLTGRLYPANQQRFDEFCGDSERLAAWGPCGDSELATFISPTIELWGFKRFTPACNLAVELSQPLIIHDAYGGSELRPTYFPNGRQLGGAAGLLVDCRQRTLAIGGPQPANQACLVLNTAERNARINIRGWGRWQAVSLAPYSVALVPLPPAPWPGRRLPFREITLAAEPRQDIMYLPCFARVAATPAEAARICADLGQPEAFWKTFGEEDLEQIADPLRRYLLAVQTERWELAERWEAEAVRAGQALAAAARSDPTNVAVNGHNGFFYNSLARIRLQKQGLSAKYRDEFSWKALMVESMASLELAPAQRSPGALLETTMNLPLRTARGVYELNGKLLVIPDPERVIYPMTIEYTLNQRQTWTGYYPTNPPGWMPFSAHFTANAELQPSITVRSTTPLKIYFQNITLRWSLASTMASLERTFISARAAHALHRGRPAAALELLNGLDPAPELPGDLEIRQLKFAALRACGEPEAVPLRAAARNVLDLAPTTYACLLALANTDPMAKTLAGELSANLRQPLACGPFLALVGYSYDPARRELRCVFEVLKNETPPLAAALYSRQHGRWRRQQAEPLSARPTLERGERGSLRLKLNDSFGAAPALENIGLGIESAVQWHPSTIPIAGRAANLIPLQEIMSQ